MRIRRTNREVLEEILEASEQIALEKGVSSISLKQVAKLCRMDMKVLVRRFPDDETLIQFYASQFDNFLESCFDINVPGSISDYFVAVIESFVSKLKSSPQIQQLIIWELTDSTPQGTISGRKRDDNLSRIMAHFFPANESDTEYSLLRSEALVAIAGMIYITLLRDQDKFFDVDFYSKKGEHLLYECVKRPIVKLEEYLLKKGIDSHPGSSFQ